MKTLAKAAVQGVACGLVIGMVLLIGGAVWSLHAAGAQARPGTVADVVKARRFEVVDARGRTRASLGEDKLGLGLTLCDAEGNTQASLRVFSLFTDGSVGTPELALFDPSGKQRVSLQVSKVSLTDQLVERSAREGRPALILWDAAGETRALLRTEKDGTPSLELLDRAGRTRATLGATTLETTKTEEVRVRPESSLVLFDRDGTVIWKAPY